MLSLPSTDHIWKSYLSMWGRFGIAHVCGLVGVGAALFLVDLKYSGDYEALFRLMLTALLLFPVLISMSISRDTYGIKTTVYLSSVALTLILGALYWKLWAPEAQDFDFQRVVRFFGLMGIAILSMSVAGFLQKNATVSQFWEYNRLLVIQLIVAAIYSILLLAGLLLAFTAISALFDVDFKNAFYARLVVLALGFFLPTYLLSNFPTAKDYKNANLQYDTIFINFVKYILVGLTTLYFVILYVYAAKIFVEMELPKGWISKLVIGFSAIGILTYLLNYKLPQIDKSTIVNTFHTWFFRILFVPIVLLFIAIFRRISDYGITEERYFILLLGFWLLLIATYFNLSKKDDIRIIPISLILFFAVAILGGPLSSFSVAQRSQSKRLNTAIAKKNGSEVYSIVKYLIDHGYENPVEDHIDNDTLTGQNNHEKAIDFLNGLNLKTDNIHNNEKGHRSYSRNRDAITPISNNYTNIADFYCVIDGDPSNKQTNIIVISKQDSLHITIPSDSIYLTVALEEIYNQLPTSHEVYGHQMLDTLDFTFHANNRPLKVIFNDLSINNLSSTSELFCSGLILW